MLKNARAGLPAPVWLVAALAAVIAAAIAFYHPPIASAALFEYIGRTLLEGKVLYRDVWDDKLPSIYYLNALWQLLFGSRYVLHWLAQVTVLLATLALFAAFARRAGIEQWAPATFVLAVLLSLPPLRHFNYTETYAELFIMAALVAAQAEAAIASGVLLTLAATFWLPAVFQAVAVLAVFPQPAARWRFVVACIVSAIGCAALLTRVFGSAALLEALRETYGWGAIHWGRGLLATELHQIWNSLNATLLVIPAVLALVVLHRPTTDHARFALLWFAGALIGTASSLAFFQHDFIPAVAPLVFLIAAFAQGWQPSPVRQMVNAALILAFGLHLFAMFALFRDGIAAEIAEARETLAVGRQLDAALPRTSRILVYGYASGIYLSARRDAAGRFPNHADTLPLSRRERAEQTAYLTGARHADAIVASRHATFFPALDGLVREQFTGNCRLGTPAFHVYLRRTVRAAGRCG